MLIKNDNHPHLHQTHHLLDHDRLSYKALYLSLFRRTILFQTLIKLILFKNVKMIFIFIFV